MNSLIHLVQTHLPQGQRRALAQFLEEVQTGRVPGNTEELQRLLTYVGELLPAPNSDVTLSEGYNGTLRSLLANLAGMYAELDRVEAAQDGMLVMNQQELDRMELALRDLASILEQAQRLYAPSLQYHDVFFETFGPGTEWERGRDWYLPNPSISSSTQVESFLPAYIDPQDRSLKLRPGGDFSRSTNTRGEPLVRAEIEELLGLSLDRVHDLDKALDGRNDTYWRELILSSAPIEGDPLTTPWLPETYTGGAACRVHLQFPFAVPFTELQLRPFSSYPVRALQVIWDNRKDRSDNLLVDADFTSGAVTWLSYAPSGTVEFESDGGYDNAPHAVLTPGGARATVTNAAQFALANETFGYHFHAKVKRHSTSTVRTLMQWYSSGSVLLRSDWLDVLGPDQEWFEYSKLLIPPTTAAYGLVTMMADGSGSVCLTDVQLSPTAGVSNLNETAELESGILTLPVEGATATDVWLVLCQPHYEFLQVAMPESHVAREEVWEEILLAAESRADQIFNTTYSNWQLESGKGLQVERELGDESLLLQQAKQLGGRVRQLVVDLLRYVKPGPETVQLNRYLYVLGAWEITVRHREYAPQGLWVSTPYTPRGEVREVRLLTNPPLSQLTAGDPPEVRFWLTARAEDGVDKAQEFNGRATFAAAHEEAADRSDTHFSLIPITKSEAYSGTDYRGILPLNHHPYVDRERVWEIQRTLTEGDVAWPLQYDPNQESYHLYQVGNPEKRAGLLDGDWELVHVDGYRPLRISIEFPNGTYALPDILGPVHRGDFGYAGPELLRITEVEGERYSEDDVDEDGLPDPDFQISPEDLQAYRKAVRRNRRKRNQRNSRRVKLLDVALQTRFQGIVTSPKGSAFTLYWHKSSDVVTGAVPTSGNIITSGDVLISPSLYTVDPVNGIITVHATPPSNNAEYDAFVAYYHYYRSEVNGREEFDTQRTGSVPTSGIDYEGVAVQTYPVTRNMTDYVQGDTARLRAPVLSELAEDYYPVYEYLIDERGRVIFAQNFHPFSDTPVKKITVEYETLAIEPRLMIEFPKRSSGGFAVKSPVLHDFTLAMNSRQ
jgi:hypothetical protein